MKSSLQYPAHSSPLDKVREGNNGYRDVCSWERVVAQRWCLPERMELRALTLEEEAGVGLGAVGGEQD